MKAGILGFARSGKTTLFNALPGAQAAVGAYGSREANRTVIKVPDERVSKLSDMFKPKKTTYAEIEFVDIAPNESADDQKALDAAALRALKATDALVHVVRAFQNDGVLHPLDGVNAARDAETMDEELKLSDLLIIEKRIERLEKERRKDQEYELMLRCRAHIESGAPLRTVEFTPRELGLLSGFTFLSQKPLMLVGNYGEDAIGQDDPSGLRDYAAQNGFSLIDLCGAMEMEIAQLPAADRAEFRESLGLGEESKGRFIRAAYDMLGLMSFLTVGPDEVRAWTIRKNTPAVESAGVIHSDIQRGFIRAEVMGYGDFMEAGSAAKLKEQGKLRLEGKEYIVQDGDIINFRFNV